MELWMVYRGGSSRPTARPGPIGDRHREPPGAKKSRRPTDGDRPANRRQ